MLKSKKLLKIVAILTLSLSLGAIGYLALLGSVWSQLDYQVLDYFYKKAVAAGHGVKKSGQIAYLIVNDETYHYFGKNTLDRRGLARVNDALSELRAEAVAYDLIFARPSHPPDDQRFAESIRENGAVYLPIGFGVSSHPTNFAWEYGPAYQRLHTDFLVEVEEQNVGAPWHARRASIQHDPFFAATKGAGHISALADDDGVFRHVSMLVRVDSLFVPTLTLSIFLDYVEIPFDSVKVTWGEQIFIPAIAGSFIQNDLRIPIDRRGMAFVPFADTWGNDFKQMTVHTFLERMADDSLEGEMRNFFEGAFVFIGEASIGIADLGTTPLESEVPLIAIHAALMNAFLAEQCYREWPFLPSLGILALAALLFGVAACFKHNSVLYVVGIVVFASLGVMTWLAIRDFSLLPLMTIGRGCAFIFLGLIAGLQIAISKEQLFIRNAFSKYVPDRVITELLAHPEYLQLGGEERELTVLFCDLDGFTALSEDMPPRQLVRSLNDYFSEMTNIILEEGGIIDKYLGDAIMAEFGAPLRLPDHPVSAVHAALKMQKRLVQIQESARQQGKPLLRNRVGINTGQMVVGNMGSHQTFDYTVVGDAVNLAARLESANKFYGSSIMISESTHRKLPPGIFRTRLLDIIKVKGKSQAIKVFEVYGLYHDDLSPLQEQYYQLYEKAISAYLNREFDAALKLFDQARRCRLGDPAVRFMLRRIRKIVPAKLSADWDGSFALTIK